MVWWGLGIRASFVFFGVQERHFDKAFGGSGPSGPLGVLRLLLEGSFGQLEVGFRETEG